MRTTHRAAAVAASALAVTTVLGGCAQLDQWTGASAAAEPPTPTATPTGTPRPSESSPSASPSPSSSPSPSETPSATPTATPTASESPKPSPSPTPKRTSLRYGDSGPKVRELQERLSGLGYWLGDVDGKFGSLTQQAVFALQKSAGLSRDGVVGPKTRKALAAGARPSPKLEGNGVEVDIDRQIIMVVRGGKAATVINTSTGNGEPYTSSAGRPARAVTPKGSFEVVRQVDGPDDSELGKLWRPKYFYRGWAVHGSPNIPPYPASHGCARVSNAAMNMFWSSGVMKIGTPVLVH
ncbi:murein L,D-transpeptidase [Phycicoccus sp. CSK15P-2]|uniref:L,D-transpeptidase family protein n=1 Tax=Phycicoccus sp. CSK15P-2 TaxID=2807627 RepID=UPI00194EF560|nr:L,D-transpeptidase family protein [Phycicoccus sp. CSK15P-2]MBM6405145.1 murein L,D-transpeptidase [Phycicoccus sp. CSK15P-2]